jgi:hypothetical protein
MLAMEKHSSLLGPFIGYKNWSVVNTHQGYYIHSQVLNLTQSVALDKRSSLVEKKLFAPLLQNLKLLLPFYLSRRDLNPRP